MGTSLVVGDTHVGLTGDSGMVEGAHLHIQEWKGDVYTTRQPQNAFKGGTVVMTSDNVDQAWGRYVTVLNDDGWNDTYAHLERIDVKVGQTIKDVKEFIVTDKEAHDVGVAAYRAVFHREPESATAAKAMGRSFEANGVITPTQIINALGAIKIAPEWKKQDALIKSPASKMTLKPGVYVVKG
jgi:uncharacterized protein (DUF2147 family)